MSYVLVITVNSNLLRFAFRVHAVIIYFLLELYNLCLEFSIRLKFYLTVERFQLTRFKVRVSSVFQV